MVSILSARLLARQSNPSRSSIDKNSQKGILQNETVSGYSADKESSVKTRTDSAHPLPGYIGLYHSHKRRPSDAEERAKRRRMGELNYAAATAKSDLTHAGIICSSVSRKRCRVAPYIDISNVTLEYSSGSDSSPFSLSSKSGWTCARYEILTDFGRGYQDLVVQTASAYQSGTVTPQRSKSPGNCSDSSSSLSDTESEDSQNVKNIVVLNARLDDRNLDEGILVSDDEQPTRHFASCPMTVSIPMEEALSLCKFPRLVTLASPPYRVVFCNAAFSVATQFSSAETLGKSLHELVAPTKPSEQTLCLELCAASSSDGDDIRVNCQRRDDKGEEGNGSTTLESRMKVTPLMSRRTVPLAQGCDALGDIRELNNITHFSVDLSHPEDLLGQVVASIGRTAERQVFVTAMG